MNTGATLALGGGGLPPAQALKASFLPLGKKRRRPPWAENLGNWQGCNLACLLRAATSEATRGWGEMRKRKRKPTPPHPSFHSWTTGGVACPMAGNQDGGNHVAAGKASGRTHPHSSHLPKKTSPERGRRPRGTTLADRSAARQKGNQLNLASRFLGQMGSLLQHSKMNKNKHPGSCRKGAWIGD